MPVDTSDKNISKPSVSEVCAAFKELGAKVLEDSMTFMGDNGHQYRMSTLRVRFPVLAGISREKYQKPLVSSLSKKTRKVLGSLENFYIEDFSRYSEWSEDHCEIMISAPPDTLIKLLSAPRLFPLRTRHSPIRLKTVDPRMLLFELADSSLQLSPDSEWFRPISLQFCKETGFVEQLLTLNPLRLETCVPSLDITPWVSSTLEMSIEDLNFYASCFGISFDFTKRPIMLGDISRHHNFRTWTTTRPKNGAGDRVVSLFEQFFDSIVVSKMRDKLGESNYENHRGLFTCV